MTRLSFETAARTHRGLVRRENEDCYFVDPVAGLWAVADGMGGHAAGAFASHAVVDALATVGRPASGEDLMARVHARLTSAHERLREHAAANGLGIVGTTVVALMVHGRHYACVWSGDSRLYHLRDGTLRQVSRDHSEVEEMAERGIITREEAGTWAGRNAITRAVGVHERLLSDVAHGDVMDHDAFVLCSDGLTLHVDETEIARIAGGAAAADAAAAELVDLAVRRGGGDNVTVIVARCTGPGPGSDTVMRPRGSAR